MHVIDTNMFKDEKGITERKKYGSWEVTLEKRRRIIRRKKSLVSYYFFIPGVQL